MLQKQVGLALAVVACVMSAAAQEVPVPQLTPGTARRPLPFSRGADTTTPQMITLEVPKNTPLQVVLPADVRVRSVGQSIQGRIVEPVFAFDHVVVPVGTKALGTIIAIEPLSGKSRTMAALDADFTPVRQVHVEFTELVLKNGRRLPMQTHVSPGSGQVLRFVSSPEDKKKAAVEDEAVKKAREAKQQAKDTWDRAMSQVKSPGRLHRVKRYVQAQLPVHPQYIPAGTIYFAELQAPLEFGTEPMTPKMAETIGSMLPAGAMVHARLMTPLNSATSHQGDTVEAVVSQPLFEGQELILPQGSLLKGAVLQVQPARMMKRNGQLRITFRQLVPPEGVQQKVEATLAGVQAGKNANVKLDAEGGAEATNPKSRYLSTALSLALAAASTRVDHDGDGSTPGARAAGGANGFKLVGLTLGILVHSRPFGYTMGAYGAGRSLYSHFIARGTDVVFPRDTAMEIALATRAENGPTPVAPKPGGGGGEGN
jgi:hypothetical protein